MLQTIFRMAHTLKGNSASLGFTGVAEFAHALEDQLERLRKRTRSATPGLVTVLLESIDALREMLPVAVEGNHEIVPRHQEVLRRARRRRARVAGGPDRRDPGGARGARRPPREPSRGARCASRSRSSTGS